MMSQGWNNWYWRVGLVSICTMAGAIAFEQSAFAQFIDGALLNTQGQSSTSLSDVCNFAGCFEQVPPYGIESQEGNPDGHDPDLLKNLLDQNILQQNSLQQINPTLLPQLQLNLPANGSLLQPLQ